MREKFSSSRILNTQSPDEIIALGCAKQCSLIANSKHLKEIQNTDLSFKCTSAPIFLKVRNIFFCYNMLLVCLHNSLKFQNGSDSDYIQICKSHTPFPVRRSYNLKLNLAEPVLILLESSEKCLAKIDLKEFKTAEIILNFNIKL